MEASVFCDCGGQGDPGTAATMGHAFGKLTWYWHVTTYSLLPLEQCVFPHLSKGNSNMLHLTQASILCASPPFVVFHLVYAWGTQKFRKSQLPMEMMNKQLIWTMVPSLENPSPGEESTVQHLKDMINFLWAENKIDLVLEFCVNTYV